jgi:protein-S-isoprenylcysteine O-methyltransferase Ste14
MRRARILPPTWLLLAITLMAALRVSLPGWQLIAWPWTLLGLVPALLGIGLNAWGSRLFAASDTTIKPHETPTHLIAAGPYRLSRNPMYLGFALIIVGLATLLGATTPWLAIPLFVWIIDRRFIAGEEIAMEQAFGEEFRRYRVRVRRWV